MTIILLNTDIFVIDCSTFALKIHKKIFVPESFFQSINTVMDIIYGEMDLKQSTQFETEWSFLCMDTFVATDGSIPFYIDGEIMSLVDWAWQQISFK